MKKIILLVLLSLGALVAVAQTANKSLAPTYYHPDYLKPIDHNALIRQKLQLLLQEPEIQKDPNYQSTGTDLTGNKTSAINVTELSTASNAYTIINSRINQIMAVDGETNAKDIVMWIHRQNVDEFGGSPTTTANGVLRADILLGENVSKDCTGDKWLLNVGPFNPIPFRNAARPRYPQGVFHRPEGNTDFNKGSIVWVAPCTDGNSWGNYNWGSAWNLCNIGNNNGSTVNQPDKISFDFLSNSQDNKVFIPGGLSEGKKGEFWFFDQAYQPQGSDGGYFLDSLFLFKGTIDASNKVTWRKYQTWRLPLFLDKENKPYFSDNANMAFSPDGKHGWCSVSADLEDAPGVKDYESTPIFWHTHDYGATWQGPIVVKLSKMTTVVDSIRTLFRTESGGIDTSSGIPFLLNSSDIVVDKNGNPHFFVNVGNQSRPDPHPDSLRYFTAFMHLFDITTFDQGKTWNAIPIWKQRKYLGPVRPTTTFNADPYLQASVDPTGEIVYFSWLDDTASSRGFRAMEPDLFGRALRISDNYMTAATSITQDDRQWRGKVYFPTVSPTFIKKDNGTYHIPTIFLQLFTTAEEPCTFYYINNRNFDPSTLKAPEKDVEMEILSPTPKSCFASEAEVKIRIKNVGSVATYDTMDVYYSVNEGTPVLETIIMTGNPIKPGESREYTFKTKANIAVSNSYLFRVWTNEFRDINFKNSQKEVLLENFGGANKEIFEQTTIAGCGVVELNTGLSSLETTWKIDGRTIGTGSKITIDETTTGVVDGKATVTVEVKNPNCDPNILTDNVQIVINPSPVVTVPTSNQICAKDAPLKITMAEGTTSANYEYTWFAKERRNLTQVATTNELTVTTNGEYLARLKNKTTGCITEKEIFAFIWDIKLGERQKFYNDNWKDGICEPKSIDLSAQNPSIGPGVKYTWTIDGQPVENNSSTLVTQINKDITKKTVYKVVAIDPLNCNAASPATMEVSVVTYSKTADPDNPSKKDTLDARAEQLNPLPDGNFDWRDPNNEIKVLTEQELHFKNISTAGRTPITNFYWSVRGTATSNIQYVEGQIGNMSTKTSGTEELKFFFKETTRDRTKANLQLLVASGACMDTIVFRMEVLRRTSRPALKIMDSNLEVYPNPSTGVFNINYELTNIESGKLEVTDLTGKVVYIENIEATNRIQKAIDLNHLSNGVYILKLETPSLIATQKILRD